MFSQKNTNITKRTQNSGFIDVLTPNERLKNGKTYQTGPKWPYMYVPLSKIATLPWTLVCYQRVEHKFY